MVGVGNVFWHPLIARSATATRTLHLQHHGSLGTGFLGSVATAMTHRPCRVLGWEMVTTEVAALRVVEAAALAARVVAVPIMEGRRRSGRMPSKRSLGLRRGLLERA